MKSVIKVLLLSAFCYQLSMAQATVVVSGVVKDADGAVVPNTKVQFIGKDYQKTFVTDQFGDYRAEIPSAEFVMKINRSGFCTVERPRFSAKPNQRIEFNFILFPCAIYNTSYTDLETKRMTTEDVTKGPFSEKIWTFCNGTKDDFQLLVQFGKVHDNQNRRADYEGFSASIFGTDSDGQEFTSTKIFPVTVMFNLETISADNISIFRNENRIVLKGNLIWNNQEVLDQTSELQIQFCPDN